MKLHHVCSAALARPILFVCSLATSVACTSSDDDGVDVPIDASVKSDVGAVDPADARGDTPTAKEAGVDAASDSPSDTLPDAGTPPQDEVAVLVFDPKAGAMLKGRVYAKQSLPLGRRPAIAILPGAGAPKNAAVAINTYAWAGRALANAGYVALFVVPAEDAPESADPTGYAGALTSAIDCLTDSKCNPHAAITDNAAIGIAGHSQGARAAAVVQAQDLRVKALVAWDNLSTSPNGDESTGARCDVIPTGKIVPRVPAMGQASETCNKGPEAKRAGWALWRVAGIPSMQLSFAGFEHNDWARGFEPQRGPLIEYYTIAWFDRYLKNELGATARLLSRAPAGVPIQTALSARYLSSYFDGTVLCDDLRMSCP